MARTDAYASVAQYRSAISKTDGANDVDIELDLKAISRYLEGKLGRTFTQDAAAVTRYFTAPYSGLDPLSLDDLAAAPTLVKVDRNNDGIYETTLLTTDYELLPLDAPYGGEVQPWTQIGLLATGTYRSWAPQQRVQVTGIFGWPAVPVAIQRATIHLTAILRLESPRATTRIAELGDAMETSREAQQIIWQLLQQYRRYVIV